MTQPQRCAKHVYRPHYNSGPCDRAGVVEHEGKWYCRQHSPEAMAKRQAALDERLQKMREGFESAARRQNAMRQMHGLLQEAYDRMAGMSAAPEHDRLLVRIRQVLEELR